MSQLQIFSLSLFLYFVGWQFLSPPFVGNDEPYHTTRAYSAVRLNPLLGTPFYKRHANWIGGPLEAPAYIFGRSLRQPTVSDWRCFMHQKTIPASCAVFDWGDTTSTFDPNPTSDYPPFGYLWVGLPTLFAIGQAAYYGMRLMMLLGVLAPILFAARATHKVTPNFFYVLFFLSLPPAVAFHATSVSLDGTILGCVVATALLLGAALRDSNFLLTRQNFYLLILFSSLAVLLKSTSAATIGLMILLALMLRVPGGKRWLIWILPSYVFAAALFVIYPFAFPAVGMGLNPGAPLAAKTFGTLAALVDVTVRITFTGDFQMGHSPITLALPYAAWTVFSTALLWSNLNALQSRAMKTFVSLFILFAWSTSVVVSELWFVPWQARYGWPFSVSTFILLFSFATKDSDNRLGLKFGVASWLLLLGSSAMTAYVRFYQGIILPSKGDWWRNLVGIVGHDEVLIPIRVYFAFIAFLGCAIGLIRLCQKSHLVGGRLR